MSNIFLEIVFHSLEIENNYVDFCDEIEIIASTIYHSNDKFQKLLSLQQQVFQNFKQSLFQTGLFLEFSVRVAYSGSYELNSNTKVNIVVFNF